MPNDYLYLHGFASSPRSQKAQFLKQRFAQQGLILTIPDLNQPGFTQLTLSRQIQQARTILMSSSHDWCVIGSSFGGLTAAWLGEQPDLAGRIKQLVLLAPAFQFLEQWLPRLGKAALNQWRETGFLDVYHYGEQQQLSLHYDFVEDAKHYREAHLGQSIPTLILHGRQDEVIALNASQHYAAQRPWVTLIELESDHALITVQNDLWREIRRFLSL